MSINYTTRWARQEVKSVDRYQAWVQNLQHGDRVIVQEFIPMGDYNNCFHSQVECWRFWDAEIRFDRDRADPFKFKVFYNNDIHPYKNGYAVYWNSDENHGEVFPTRVVPFHHDLVKRNCRFIDCHAPVWEPDWYYKCVVLVATEHMRLDWSERFKTLLYYKREVIEGVLFVLFGDDSKIKDRVAVIPEACFLYSEPLVR
jgi:hypothetical protein